MFAGDAVAAGGGGGGGAGAGQSAVGRRTADAVVGAGAAGGGGPGVVTVSPGFSPGRGLPVPKPFFRKCCRTLPAKDPGGFSGGQPRPARDVGSFRAPELRKPANVAAAGNGSGDAGETNAAAAGLRGSETFLRCRWRGGGNAALGVAGPGDASRHAAVPGPELPGAYFEAGAGPPNAPGPGSGEGSELPGAGAGRRPGAEGESGQRRPGAVLAGLPAKCAAKTNGATGVACGAGCGAPAGDAGPGAVVVNRRAEPRPGVGDAPARPGEQFVEIASGFARPGAGAGFAARCLPALAEWPGVLLGQR